MSLGLCIVIAVALALIAGVISHFSDCLQSEEECGK